VREFEGVLYLELEDALDVYTIIFECTLQQAADQLRNRSGLESALSRPLMYAQYQTADLALQAAVLIHSIAEGQPFIEGNKRTADLAGLVFLEANGHALDVLPEAFAQWIEDLSAGLTEDELATRIRTALVEI